MDANEDGRKREETQDHNNTTWGQRRSEDNMKFGAVLVVASSPADACSLRSRLLFLVRCQLPSGFFRRFSMSIHRISRFWNVSQVGQASILGPSLASLRRRHVHPLRKPHVFCTFVDQSHRKHFNQATRSEKKSNSMTSILVRRSKRMGSVSQIRKNAETTLQQRQAMKRSTEGFEPDEGWRAWDTGRFFHIPIL